MRSPLALLAMVVAVMGCAEPRLGASVPAVAPAPDLPQRGFVLLQPTASLYVAPDDAAEHAQYFPSLAQAQKDEDAEPFPVFRLTGVDRERRWAAVETSWNDDARHCAQGLGSLGDYALRLHVRVEDLATVTTRETRIVYPDDTAVTFTAGVPLLNIGGRWHAISGQLSLPAPVPAEGLGLAYEPSPHFATEGEIAWLDDWTHPGVRLAGVTYEHAPLPRFDEELLPIFARRPLGDRELVTLRTRCVQYEIAVSPQAVQEEASPMGGFGILGGSAGDRTHVRKGATVYARHGEAIGVVRAETDLWVEEVSGAAGRRCFHHPLRAGNDAPGLDLCFADADLQ